MRRIAILGGTFNPIHNGHIHLAEGVIECTGADHVLIIPTSLPPHKDVPDLASPAERLKMCQLVADENPVMQVDDRELVRGGKSYTYTTLLELHREYTDSQFYLICGADMLVTFTQWYRYREIFKLATICCAPRGNISRETMEARMLALEKEGGRFCYCDIPYLPISSTDIRYKIKHSQDVSDVLPPAVYQYIIHAGIYRKSVRS